MITFSLRFNLPSSLVSCAAGGDASLLDQKSIELKISNRQTDEEIGNITLDFGPPSPEVSPLSSSCNRLKNSSGEFMEKKFKSVGMCGGSSGTGSIPDHRRTRSQSVNDRPVILSDENIHSFDHMGKSGVAATDLDFTRRVSVTSFQSTDNQLSGLSAEENMIVEQKKPRFNSPRVSTDFTKERRSSGGGGVSRQPPQPRRKTGFSAVILPPSVLFEETQLDCVSISSKSLDSCGCSSIGDHLMAASEESINKMDEVCDDVTEVDEVVKQDESFEEDRRSERIKFSEERERESSSGPKAPRRRKQGISNQGTAPYNAPASIVPPASELDVVKESPRRSTRSTDPQPSSFSNTYNTRAFKLSAPAQRRKCSDFESFTNEFTKLCALRGRSSLSAEVSPYIKESTSDMVLCKICEYATKSELSMKRHVSKTHADWRQSATSWKKVSTHHRSKVYSSKHKNSVSSRTPRRTTKSKSSDASRGHLGSPTTSRPLLDAIRERGSLRMNYKLSGLLLSFSSCEYDP